MWLTLFILAAAIAIGIHFRWRNKFARTEQQSRAERESFQRLSSAAMERALAEQETLFDSMIEGVLLLDEQGRIRMANRAFHRLFGTNADLRGKTPLEALRRHEISDLLEQFGDESTVLDYEMKLPGLEERWLQINAAVISGGDGRRLGAILVFHDLTRLKQLERTREEFVANVSHELRTPLSLIKGYAETLIDSAHDNPEVTRRFLKIIERNTQRLDLLIQDLLTISALEAGRIKLEFRPVNVRLLADKVLGDLKARAAEKNIRLVNCVPDLTAAADENRLEQVLANLVDNAIKYGHGQGMVSVGGKKTGAGQIEIFVQDDGPGIPPESLDRVFERFYRVDKARSREQGGTGLGLSIVKHIVQNHGGKVWVKSEPGKGATFFFTLPQG